MKKQISIIYGEHLKRYDIIFNTVPHLILKEDNIKYIKEDCLIIDLASKPGGVDKEVAEKKKIKLIPALALPGKIAPVTTAEYMKQTIYNIIKENNL